MDNGIIKFDLRSAFLLSSSHNTVLTLGITNSTFSSSLQVDKNITCTLNASIGGSASISSNLNVGGKAKVNGTLEVMQAPLSSSSTLLASMGGTVSLLLNTGIGVELFSNPLSNINLTTNRPGEYLVSPSTTGTKPFEYALIKIWKHHSTNILQHCQDLTNNGLAIRTYTSGAWTPWTYLVDNSSFVGMVSHFAYNAIPDGWLKANGQYVSRTTYAQLFNKIGVTYGSTTDDNFRLPDLRGEFIRGWIDGRTNVDTGRVFASPQGSAVGNHRHNMFTNEFIDPQTQIFPTNQVSRAGYNGGSDGNQNYVLRGTTTEATLGRTSNNINGETETRPRNIALLACIKY